MVTNPTSPPALVIKVQLPLSLAVGRYDSAGVSCNDGNVFIGPKAVGITNVWAVIPQALLPRQRGEVTLENVPGTKVINGVVSEWIPGASGEWGPGFGADKMSKFNIPYIGIVRIAGIGLERCLNAVKVIGLNTSDSEVHMAAGIIIPVAS